MNHEGTWPYGSTMVCATCGTKNLDGARFCLQYGSPLSDDVAASRACLGSPPFAGSRPFSRANGLLRGSGRGEIDWNLAV